MKLWATISTTFKRYFLLGLIVLLPFVVTVKFLLFLIGYLDSVIRFDRIIGFHIPGLGIILSVGIILIVGALSRNYLGRKLIALGDRVFDHIPMFRVVYKVVKQVLQTYAARDKAKFSKVVLFEYPRKGLYTLAFVTGKAVGEVQQKTQESVINLFVPTTPNPTSGFYIMIPEKDAIVLDMSIEDAFKLVVSGGMVSPDTVPAAQTSDAG